MTTTTTTTTTTRTEYITREEIQIKFEDPVARSRFLQNVFTILSAQLLFTFFFVLISSTNEELRMELVKRPWLLIVSMIVTLVVIIAMSCCQSARRNPPWNYILLSIFTICETILLCFVTMHYKTRLILFALGITALICILAAMIACLSKWDFTSSGLMCFLLMLTIIFAVFGLIRVFIPSTPILTIIYAALGAGLFSIWLIVDIQLMIGGRHANAVAPEDHCFAALSIYIDIILIFQYILMLLNICDN